MTEQDNTETQLLLGYNMNEKLTVHQHLRKGN